MNKPQPFNIFQPLRVVELKDYGETIYAVLEDNADFQIELHVDVKLGKRLVIGEVFTVQPILSRT